MILFKKLHSHFGALAVTFAEFQICLAAGGTERQHGRGVSYGSAEYRITDKGRFFPALLHRWHLSFSRGSHRWRSAGKNRPLSVIRYSADP